MAGAIICIGDELISGRVAEINSRFALSRLGPLGLVFSRLFTVGDDPAAIAEALGQALSIADYLVVTGGLGTTADDLTVATAADFFGRPLVESAETLANLEACFAQLERRLTASARRLALLPEGARPLARTSAGFQLEAAGGQPVYFLPGVPTEFRRLVERVVAPELLARFGSGPAAGTRMLRTYGLGENLVGERLAGLTDGRPGAGVGFYPVFPEVHVLLGQKGADPDLVETELDQLEDEARRRLEGFVVSSGGRRLEEEVARLMIARGLTLALAESCTGGLVGHRITGVAGSSDFFERGLVVYSNRAKEELLGVRGETLAACGAVSAQTAAEMAAGARRSAGVDLGLAITGIAGPGGGTPQKPVGTVFFGLASDTGVLTEGRRFHGDRTMVKAQAAETALDILRRHLEGHAPVRRP